ncbi:hypothetical protein K1T71_000795 [Dendrolimus kikuchii]|uniref:Uncharacterized protein n=1 Tax=Dendrolimus kikuchii TaxID=765133 RepID=A0ACC1DL65_9NEOP|nr:hypothetical protein K1T71_000795 [Dendrolimus kikuchii]
MELDFRLERDHGSPWGFRLIGGKGVDLPLTIIEVLPKSPAEKAGLQNGDAIAKIGGKSTDNLSLEEALLLVDEAQDCLCMGILRGLYDPVIDDQDPVFEEPADFDRRSEPTEADIREIERKSSLLKSAIDETIKSIEDYKEEVEMESKKEIKIEKSSKTESITFSSKSTEEVSNGIEEKLDKTGRPDEKKSEPISEEVDSSAEKTNQIESSDVEIITNGLDKAESLQDTKANEESLKEEKIDLPNGDIIENSLKEVEKHVDDIKKIVQNTDNIANLTETNKIQADTKSFEIEKNESIEIKETDIKEAIVNENKEIKIESDNTNTAEDVAEIVDKNSEEVSKEEIKTQEVSSENLKTEDVTQKSEEVSKEIEQVAKENKDETSEVDLEVKEVLKDAEVKLDPLLVIKPVEFHPENIRSSVSPRNVPVLEPPPEKEPYKTETGEIIGTIQGIVDGLEDAVVDEEVAKELGKPGLPDEKIAELISGEAEMLREAHVMGLSRVISSHMHREDDSSVDFKKIKPLVESLKDSEVLKALNEELMRTREEEKKKEERRWTKFLQKPARPVPKAKGGYPGYLYREVIDEEPYKVKIVKQPKPKVAPDYKPEDFDTGPLPWEEREQIEATAPPPNLVPEEPILVPEEAPEFLEAVDPLPESEVPDLEDTGIPLPPPPPKIEVPLLPEEEVKVEETQPEVTPENVIEESSEETMDNNLVENLVRSIHNMVDPNASLEQQLAQMRAQLKALAELPCVIQQTLELVTRQLFQLSHQQNYQLNAQAQVQSEHVEQNYEVTQSNEEINQSSEVKQDAGMNGEATNEELRSYPAVEEVVEPQELKPELSQEEIDMMKREEEEMIEEQRRTEKQKKEILQAKLEQESRQLKQRPTPRVGKPKPVFGPLNPDRPVVLPGGRRWRGPQDAYNEELIKETLTAQAELIQGKALGVNFMKYEKPPVSLEHLKNSEVYKLIHDMDETPLKRVELLTPVIAEADYRERCRSRTPNIIKPHNIPQQLMP